MHAWGLCGTSMYSWSPGRTGWQIKVWYVACGAPGFEVLYIDNSHGEERYRVVIRRADNKADWGAFLWRFAFVQGPDEGVSGRNWGCAGHKMALL
jgi:hypothetical protein